MQPKAIAQPKKMLISIFFSLVYEIFLIIMLFFIYKKNQHMARGIKTMEKYFFSIIIIIIIIIIKNKKFTSQG
jgi:hypothetical protein